MISTFLTPIFLWALAVGFVTSSLEILTPASEEEVTALRVVGTVQYNTICMGRGNSIWARRTFRTSDSENMLDLQLSANVSTFVLQVLISRMFDRRRFGSHGAEHQYSTTGSFLPLPFTLPAIGHHISYVRYSTHRTSSTVHDYTTLDMLAEAILFYCCPRRLQKNI